MVGGNKCVNCKVKQCDLKDQPPTSYPLQEWCGDCIRMLKNTSKGTKCDICHKDISEDAFINLEETEPKLAKYDKDKDWLIHPMCFKPKDNEKYKDYQLGKCYEVVVIYGWKKQVPPLEKCADCQKEEDNLITFKDNNRDIKICQDCKQKRENNNKKCEICNSSADVIKWSAPPMINKGSFFDKIVNEEKRQECHLCKTCRDTGKGNKPLKDEPTTEKCADCQQEKDNLLTIQDQGKEIKVCQDCKIKRNKPEIPRKDKDNDEPNKPNPENEKIWGKDFGQLKPSQREGRIATNNSWKKTCQDGQSRTSLLCPYCQEKFDYKKSIEDYLPAKTEVEGRLNTHKPICPLKNDKVKQKSKAQEEWDKLREKIKKTGKGRRFYECKKCWGKIVQDINIVDVELAKKQNWADLKQHEKECHKPKGERVIAVYHSPNQGGNKHADINAFTYDDMDDEPLKLDNENQEYQQQKPNQLLTVKEKGMSGGTIALIVIGIAILVGVIIFLLTRGRNNKKKHDRKRNNCSL